MHIPLSFAPLIGNAAVYYTVSLLLSNTAVEAKCVVCRERGEDGRMLLLP